MKPGRQQSARDALESVHHAVELAAPKVARAVELSQQLRDAMTSELDAIAVRLVQIAHVAEQASAVHTAAQRIGLGN
jgi:chemotaxis regulatin CheY-phosphate phosphatase CheZ